MSNANDIGTIYFIYCEGYVKIGFTAYSDIGSRLSSMRTGNPFELRLLRTISPGSLAQEAWLHKQYQKVKGEWFSYTEHMLEIIPPTELLNETKPKRAANKQYGLFYREVAKNRGLIP